MQKESTVRFSVTVDPDVLEMAKVVAKITGHRHSFSAYVNEALRRDAQQRGGLLQHEKQLVLKMV